jgi:hypothetical protein
MTMSDSERQHLETLIRTHQRHLDIREQQAARYGDLAVPSHIVMEIEDLKEKIAELESKLSTTSSRAYGEQAATPEYRSAPSPAAPDDAWLRYQSPTAPGQQPAAQQPLAPQPAERNQIFISYSHSDKKWLDRLMVHLKPLVRDDKLKVWNDTMIDPGATWKAEIDRALRAAKVAILLVTADFLASDFIATDELPPLLQAAETEGAIILPVIIGHSRFLQLESLSRFQTVNSPTQPLEGMSKTRREEILVKVTEAVERALKQNNKPNQASPASTPAHIDRQVNQSRALPQPQLSSTTPLQLSLAQFERLLKAFLAAFMSKADLDQLLFFGLGIQLDEVVNAADTRQNIVFNLIRWAQSQGRLEELIRAAQRTNSGNPELRAVAQELLGADA